MNRIQIVLFRIAIIMIFALICVQTGIWNGRRREQVRWAAEKKEMIGIIYNLQKGKPEMEVKKIYVECG